MDKEIIHLINLKDFLNQLNAENEDYIKNMAIILKNMMDVTDKQKYFFTEVMNGELS